VSWSVCLLETSERATWILLLSCTQVLLWSVKSLSIN